MSDWISVEDRLPPDGQQVLLAWLSPLRKTWIYETGELGFIEFMKDEYGEQITHWQPLPEPPCES